MLLLDVGHSPVRGTPLQVAVTFGELAFVRKHMGTWLEVAFVFDVGHFLQFEGTSLSWIQFRLGSKALEGSYQWAGRLSQACLRGSNPYPQHCRAVTSRTGRRLRAVAMMLETSSGLVRLNTSHFRRQ